MTECQVGESSRRQMQRLETNDGQRLQDDKQARAAGMMMMMSADGDDQADQQHEPADLSMAEPGHAVLETP